MLQENCQIIIRNELVGNKDTRSDTKYDDMVKIVLNKF